MREPSETAVPEQARSDTWAEEIVRVDLTGNVYVRLFRNGRSLLLQLSPSGAQPRVLSRTCMGDVSYNEVGGMAEREAADLARAYAVKLEAGQSAVPRHFPHLLVA